MSDQVEQWIAVISLGIPLFAFLWEFAVVGRKRLGYRIQMDTLAANETQSAHAEILEQLQRDGHRLKDPSFVLLRIENAGSAPIEAGDYLTDENDPSGIWVTFRRRQVAGIVVTELSQRELRRFFRHGAPGYTFRNDETRREGVIELPKVKLPRRAEYKILVILERWPDDRTDDDFPKPDIVGAVGTDRRWFDPLAKYFRFKLTRTESHLFASRPAWFAIGFLAAAVVVQAFFTLFLRDERRPPLDCVSGELHLHGSTAFAPAVRAAAEDYLKRCEGAGVSIPLQDNPFKGSGDGVTDLERAGEDAGTAVGEGLGDHIAFTDGPASDGHPRLIPKPVAFSVFTLVVNKDAGVENLTLKQVRDVFAGRVRNWSEVGGKDVPVHLVNRDPGSGTRSTLVDKVLAGEEPPQFTERDCAALKHRAYGSCQVTSTDTLLETTASTPGAIGYSEAAGVDDHRAAGKLVKLRIDGRQPTAEGVEDTDYPYWQTEFAYTYGEPPAGSVAAAFLNFLTQQSGRDILHEHGHGLCSEVQNSGECRPV